MKRKSNGKDEEHGDKENSIFKDIREINDNLYNSKSEQIFNVL